MYKFLKFKPQLNFNRRMKVLKTKLAKIDNINTEKINRAKHSLFAEPWIIVFAGTWHVVLACMCIYVYMFVHAHTK